MKEITIKARAKINLTLEIFEKRRDGYHDMRSVMHKIGLFDTVKIEVTETDSKTAQNAGEIRVFCSKPVCDEKDNLAYKAADSFATAYYNKTGKLFSAKITIEKNIPEKAGLGGGSADCAAVLDGLNKLLGVLNDREIEDIASTLGSDVPFMLEKYECALASGTGTTLQKLPMMPVCYCVLATPSVGLSTKEIYTLFDENRNSAPKVKVNSLIAALEQEDLVGVCNNIANQFEKLCSAKLPEISAIKKSLLDSGAYASQMTGSGSAVFGIFADEKSAEKAYNNLDKLGIEINKNICKI